MRLFAWVERADGTVELLDSDAFRIKFETNKHGGFDAMLLPPDSLVLAPHDKLRVDVKLPEGIDEPA